MPKIAFMGGVGIGILVFVQYATFAWGFYFSTQCTAGTHLCSTSWTGGIYTPGQALIVFMAIFVGSYNFLQLTPNVTAIVNGMKAAKRIYNIID
jgi:hypothetical protein